MTSDGSNGADSGGVTATRVTVLTLTYDHETCVVTVGGSAMPVSLAQMILGEAMRMLEEKRRLVAALEMRKALDEQARTQAFFNKMAGRG